MTRLKLPDGRALSYLRRGSPSSSSVILWFHGIVSSRYECLAVKQGVLERLKAVVICVDRPGYGESSPQRDRTYQQYAQDIDFLADQLQLQRFFVLGVSGGGPYALACACFLAHRVKGVLLISSAGYPGWLSMAELRKNEPKKGSWLARKMRHAATTPQVTVLLSRIAETTWGGRLLFHVLLRPITERSIEAMSEVDQRCLREGHPEYLALVRPESLRQGTAVGLLQDLRLYCCPWAFKLSDIPESIRRRTHIWHGTGDLQVSVQCAYALKDRIPEAQLNVVENGGHFKYFVCDQHHQSQALEALLGTSEQS